MRNSNHAARYHESTAKVTVWRTAALAVFLSLAAGPALASDPKASDSGAVGGLSAGATALDEASIDLGRLTERVVELEKRVDHIVVADAPPSPTSCRTPGCDAESGG